VFTLDGARRVEVLVNGLILDAVHALENGAKSLGQRKRPNRSPHGIFATILPKDVKKVDVMRSKKV